MLDELEGLDLLLQVVFEDLEDEVTSMKIIKLSPAERKIGLSIRALKSDNYETDWDSYGEGPGAGAGSGSGSSQVTLGDHFKDQS